MTNHKGLDDLLAAGGRPRRLRGAEVAAFFAQVRGRLFGPRAPSPEPGTTPANPAGQDGRPPFPVEVFPDRVAAFARRVAQAMGCPVDFPGVSMLVVGAAAVGAARSLQVKGGWDEKPGMYAVIVSPPGHHKTPAQRAVMGPIYQEQDRLYQDYLASQQKYKGDVAAYKQALRDREEGASAPEKPAEPPPLRHLFAADTTVEELANNLKDNRKGILLFRDELTAWVRSLDMYRGRGNDRQFFLSAWSGEMIKVDRKGQHDKPSVVPHPFVSVLGGIQPDLLDELEAEGGREDGFIHRILFSYPPEGEVKGWIEDEITEEDELEWQLVVSRLLNLRPVKPDGSSERPKRLQFSPEGREAFKAWCNRLAEAMNGEDFPRELTGPCSKLRAYCARFALVIHLLRVACGEAGNNQDEGQVDAVDVDRAAKLCAYFRGHFRAVYLRLQQTSDDKRVEGFLTWLQKKGLGRCTTRDVCRANVCGVRKASEAERLLAAAVDLGFGDWEGADERSATGKKKGRVAPFVLKTTR
jgi:hypothetical protein